MMNLKKLVEIHNEILDTRVGRLSIPLLWSGDVLSDVPQSVQEDKTQGRESKKEIDEGQTFG